jgi:hypothetical protein
VAPVDPAGIPALIDVIRHLHGVSSPATTDAGMPTWKRRVLVGSHAGPVRRL